MSQGFCDRVIQTPGAASAPVDIYDVEQDSWASGLPSRSPEVIWLSALLVLTIRTRRLRLRVSLPRPGQ